MNKIISLFIICLALLSGGIAFAQTNADSVDILWQADTYTPYWYQGKALYKSGDTLELVAVAQSDSSVLNPNNVIYTWEKDGTVLGSLSGPGMNTLILPTSYFDQRIRINIQARSLDGSFSASSRIVIEESSEQISVYEKDPLFGVVHNKAVDEDFILIKPEVSFLAIPFFFSVESSKSPTLSWLWKLEGREIESSDNEVVFKRTGEAGVAGISASADHVSRALEAGSFNFTILFGQ